jgi:hypothetical protein
MNAMRSINSDWQQSANRREFNRLNVAGKMHMHSGRLAFRFRRGMPNTSAYATGKHILSVSGTGDRDRWGMTAMTLPD